MIYIPIMFCPLTVCLNGWKWGLAGAWIKMLFETSRTNSSKVGIVSIFLNFIGTSHGWGFCVIFMCLDVKTQNSDIFGKKKSIFSSFAWWKIRQLIPSGFCRFLFDLLDHYSSSKSILPNDSLGLVESYAKML